MPANNEGPRGLRTDQNPRRVWDRDEGLEGGNPSCLARVWWVVCGDQAGKREKGEGGIRAGIIGERGLDKDTVQQGKVSREVGEVGK